MISFRLRPGDAIEWDSASFAGENEDLLAHLFATFLAQHGWEFLATQDSAAWEDD
jgi:hypothetical protein